MGTSTVAGLGWSRSLLMLARAEANGRLTLRAHGRDAFIHLASGRVVGFDGELGPRLGELVDLPRRDVANTAEASGACAVAAGRVSRNDLAWALRRQLRLRAREVALWGDVQARWHPGAALIRPFTDPMAAVDLVAEILRAYGENLRVPNRMPAASAPVVSPLGLYFAERAALHPHEIAASRGVVRSGAGSRFSAALVAAGLTDAPVAPEVRALTRLHARLRHEGARAVLGETRDAAAHRRALRRVAGSVHPDRFAGDPRLSRISHDLVVALSRA
jgi:hypothetical protein